MEISSAGVLVPLGELTSVKRRGLEMQSAGLCSAFIHREILQQVEEWGAFQILMRGEDNFRRVSPSFEVVWVLCMLSFLFRDGIPDDF